MRRIALAGVACVAMMGVFTALGLVSHEGSASDRRALEITGYSGDAMEPFLSPDGQYLLFNNSNDPKINTDLHWARRISDTSFEYGGRIEGANTAALEGVPSLDEDGMLYFISTRSYESTLSTVYRARFHAGRATGVELVDGLSLQTPGLLVFDAAISRDGETLYGSDGEFTGGPLPKSADLFVAQRVGNRFERLPASARIMANLNTPDLEYAPAISDDGLEIHFTRGTGFLFWRKTRIERATRASVSEPFGPPRTVVDNKRFPEAATYIPGGKGFCYHEKVEGQYRIFCRKRE